MSVVGARDPSLLLQLLLQPGRPNTNMFQRLRARWWGLEHGGLRSAWQPG